MGRLRLLLVAVLVSAVSLVAPPASSAAAATRSIDSAVVDPMPGERVIVSGVIGLAARPIALQADIGVARTWVVILRATSTRYGTFRLVYVAPQRLGALKLRVIGTTAHGGAVSTPYETVVVTRAQGALAAPPTATSGKTVWLSVLARPARAGRLVRLQRRHLGTSLWMDVVSRREVGTIGNTWFAMSLEGMTGSHEFRATFTTPTGLLATATRRLTISG